MNIKVLKLFVAILGVFAFAYIVYSNNRLSAKLRESTLQNESISKALDSIKYQGADYLDRIGNLLENDDAAIDSSFKVIVDNREISLPRVQSNPCVFVRLSTSHCWSCIKELSKYINYHVKDNTNICYLIDISSKVHIRELVAYAELKRPILYTKGNIGLPVDSIGEPYLFCLANTNKARMVLLPIKKNEQLLNVYFNHLKSKDYEKK